MQYETKRAIGIVVGGALLAMGAAFFFAPRAHAADLGGNCCADLDERIAELEATTARKGNRKISVTVYGVIDKALMHIDGDGADGKWAVGENSNVESFIGIQGSAVIAPHWSAGYVLELGVGGADSFAGGPFAGDTNGVYTRQSYGYVKSDQLGQVSIGLAKQATDEISQGTVANTKVAARMLSLRPLVGPQIGEFLDIYDGSRTNLVRYDSPLLAGAQLSASWATGGADFVDTGDVWDVALRWQGEGGGFQALAGIGYRKGVVIPTIGNFGSISGCGGTCIDPETISGSISVKHLATGLFVNAAAGRFDPGGIAGDYIGTITSWTAQAGIERKWLPLGITTVYGEYADSNDINLRYWGGGVVQHIDAAALDLYGTVRRYTVDDEDATAIMAGVKIDF